MSLVIDNTGLMPTIYDELRDMAYIEERPKDEAIFEQVNLKQPMNRLNVRDSAVLDMVNPNCSLVDYAKKYGLPYKITMIWRIQKLVKNVIYTFGLYNVYKTIIYKLGK